MVRRARPVVEARVVESARPVRTCVGCRKRAPASELLRIVAIDHGADHVSLVPDPGRRRPGRGVHLHLDLACLVLAERRRAFGRALRITGVLDTGPLAQAVRDVAPLPGVVNPTAPAPEAVTATAEVAGGSGPRHRAAVSGPVDGTADGGRVQPHPDQQGRTTDMSTR